MSRRNHHSIRGLLAATLLAAVVSACESGPETLPEAEGSLLTEALQARLVEVRPCRGSIEHPFSHVRVLVEAEQVERYDRGPFPFPTGALVVKQEYSDSDCRVPLGTTLMRKDAADYFPAFGDWRWQRLDGVGKVIEDGRLTSCASCHATTACRARDFVCSEP